MDPDRRWWVPLRTYVPRHSVIVFAPSTSTPSTPRTPRTSTRSPPVPLVPVLGVPWGTRGTRGTRGTQGTRGPRGTGGTTTSSRVTGAGIRLGNKITPTPVAKNVPGRLLRQDPAVFLPRSPQSQWYTCSGFDSKGYTFLRLILRFSPQNTQKIVESELEGGNCAENHE